MKAMDSKERLIASGLLGYVLVTALALGFLPLSHDMTIAVATFLTVVMMIATVYLVYLAVQLYGAYSIEGKFWRRVAEMMVITAIGLVAGQLVGDVRVFAAFALVGFGVVGYGMYSRLRDSGLEASARQLLESALVMAAINIVVAGIVVHLGAIDIIRDDPNVFAMQGVVILFALAATFLSTLLGRMMGGHISLGWHFISAGSVIFAVTYAVVQVLKLTGDYERVVFIESFQVLALACIAFSAYYQRKRHLELIE